MDTPLSTNIKNVRILKFNTVQTFQNISGQRGSTIGVDLVFSEACFSLDAYHSIRKNKDRLHIEI